jgi:hypothetical protein
MLPGEMMLPSKFRTHKTIRPGGTTVQALALQDFGQSLLRGVCCHGYL